MSVIETKLHLFQVQQKLGAGNAIVPFEFGLRIAPEVLNAIDVLASAGRERLAMVDAVMSVPLSNQSVIDSELVRIDGAAFGDLLLDDGPQGGPRDIGHRTGIDTTSPLQKPEDGHFARRTSDTPAFAVASEIRFVRLDFSLQRRMPLAVLGHALTDHAIDAGRAMPVDAEEPGGVNRRDFKREHLNQFVQLTI